MSLDEAKKILEEIWTSKGIDSNNETIIKVRKKAVETILEELKNKDYKDKYERGELISKEEIEEKVEELNVVENAEALEDIMNRQNYTITELVQFVLQELLEEK